MELQRHSLKLSVFTIAYESAAECRMVLQELQRQTASSEMEVLLVAPERGGIDEALLEGFGASQWVLLPEVRSCGEAMKAAVRAARAPFVTYAEEHSYFDEAWAAELIAAHEKGYDVVGFAVENANPTTLTSWAHLYGQFGPVVAPVESGERGFLAGHHVSYRRSLLLEYGDLLGDLLEDEAALFLDLRAKGKPLYIAGDALSVHVNVSRLSSLIHMEYLGQRSFASTRVKVRKWPLWKRGVYVGATPLIPWVRLGRILADIRRSGRAGQLLPRILGPLMLALTAGALGELIGYVRGGGTAAVQKTPVELQRDKYLARADPWSKEPAPSTAETA